MSTKKRLHLILDNKHYDQLINLSFFYDVTLSEMLRNTISDFYTKELLDNQTFKTFIKDNKEQKVV